jgi:UDP-glucose:(heptosyl)LPS alpha-1,3-glucosyltransferase
VLRRVNTTLSRSLALIAERWSYRPGRLRAFGAVSEGVAAELARHYPAVACNITPNGADLSRFRPDFDARVAFRSTQGTDPSTTVALFVGGDWDRKGLEIAIAAVAGARAMGEDVELWVVGEGDRVRFERISAEHGLTSHVRFYGVRHDTEFFYQSADVFVLPSAYETFSLVCFEAAACGLPLVIPPISGGREVVGADEGGLLAERAVPSVTAALARLADDATLRSALGNEARRRAQAYTWERSAASVTDLYRQLLA